MSLKSFVTNVWKKLLSFVKKTYKKVDELANKLCPVAIDVVEAMKKINDGFVGDVLETSEFQQQSGKVRLFLLLINHSSSLNQCRTVTGQC